LPAVVWLRPIQAAVCDAERRSAGDLGNPIVVNPVLVVATLGREAGIVSQAKVGESRASNAANCAVAVRVSTDPKRQIQHTVGSLTGSDVADA
jgi:hypothetical protein